MKQTISILLLTILTIHTGLACTCEISADTKEAVEQEWNRVETVLELKIIEVLEQPDDGEFFGTRILKAEILKVHKGQISNKPIEIYTEVDGGASCHYYFRLGESYLFYGRQGEKDDYYHTTICHRTGKLSERQFDLKMIREK